jgi:thiamine biosynthesis lipoprotein
MGTELNLVVKAPTRMAALAASEAAYRAVGAAEERLSTWTERSELSRVNDAQIGESIRISPLLARDLAGVLECSRATGGAFAPGIGVLVQAWGLRSGGRLPDAQEIEEARSAALLTNVRLTGTRIARLNGHFQFEEGGFGKGVGIDDAMAALAATDATGAVLDLGGQVAVWGGLESDVAIADPRRRSRAALRMRVQHGSVATTGNSERGIVVDGRRLGHVLDPRTGRPSPDFGTLTVWADDAATADCLATGLYVLGPEEALCWAAGRDDVAVVIIKETRRGLEALASPVLEAQLTVVADDLVLQFPAAWPNCDTNAERRTTHAFQGSSPRDRSQR